MTDGAEKRTLFRMSVELPIRHRLATEAEIAALEAQTEARASAPKSTLDPELTDTIARLERKLDLLLALVAPDRFAEPLMPHAMRRAELSGSGCSFRVGERVDVGRRVVCEMLLPEKPPHSMRVTARVVSCTPVAGSREFLLALAFEAIEERERDRIVRFLNRRQIEERRAAGGEA
ncbi:MAG: PilZ domain-containing protein [Myxococcota bacterium]